MPEMETITMKISMKKLRKLSQETQLIRYRLFLIYNYRMVQQNL